MTGRATTGQAPRFAVGMIVLLAALAARAEVTVPAAPEGRVSDYARVLQGPQRAALEAQLVRYEQASQQELTAKGAGGGPAQIAVVTVPSLEGAPIEDVSVRFAERWKIGSKRDDGALLLFAPADRQVRIEVGYGAEGRLPDALTGRIIRDFIGPRLKGGDTLGALQAGVAAIHQAFSGQPVTGIDPQLGAQQPAPVPLRSGGRAGFGLGGLFLVLLLFGLLGRRGGGGGGGGFLGGMLLGSLFGGGRGGGGLGGGLGGGGGGGGFSGGGGSFGGGGASGSY